MERRTEEAIEKGGLREGLFYRVRGGEIDPSAGSYVSRPLGGVGNSKQKQGICWVLGFGGGGGGGCGGCGGYGAGRPTGSGGPRGAAARGGPAGSEMKPGLRV